TNVPAPATSAAITPKRAAGVRGAGGKNATPISGYGAVFFDGTPRTEYVLLDDGQGPQVVERMDKKAFDRAIRGEADVRSLYNHNHDWILGRTTSGTLRISVDGIGLLYEVTPPDSAFGDHVREIVRRGDVNGSSFAFWPVDEVWSREGQRAIVTVTNVRLIELGPVSWPAYHGTTATVDDFDRGSIPTHITSATV